MTKNLYKAKIESDDDTNIKLRSSSDEGPPGLLIKLEGHTLEDLTTKPVKKDLRINLKRIRLTKHELKSGFIFTKARVKASDASDSSEGDTEPEEPDIKQEPAMPSDESEVEILVAKKKRVAKIVESESETESKGMAGVWIKKPRCYQSTSESSEDLDLGIQI